MCRKGLLATIAALVTLAAAAGAPAQRAGTASACSTTAKSLVKTLPNARFARLGQALCFDFTRDGRRDVVLTQWVAMNHGAHFWAAFRKRTGRGYARVLYSGDCCVRSRDEGTGISIARRATDISVSQPVYKRTDPLCCPSGGTKLGRWHWERGALHLTAVTRDRSGP